jgi:hypothetical protein
LPMAVFQKKGEKHGKFIHSEKVKGIILFNFRNKNFLNGLINFQ